MKKSILILSSALACLTLAACASQEILAENLELDVSALSQEALEDAQQVIGQTSEEKGVEITLSHTIGDPLALHLFYTVTFPEGTDPEGLLPGEVLLAEGDTSEALPYSAWGSCAEVQEDGSLLCASHFTFDKEILKPGMDIAFTLENFTREGEVVIDTTQTFAIQTENKGPVKYLDIKNQAGEMVGTCHFSAFALNATLWDWQPPADSLSGLPPVDLLDPEGQTIETRSSSGGGGFNTQLTFRTAIDPDAVAAVQVGDYVTELP